jgi:hypothetical protein
MPGKNNDRKTHGKRSFGRPRSAWNDNTESVPTGVILEDVNCIKLICT